jgi:hypothetical protein
MQTKVNSVAIRATNATGTGKTSTLNPLGDFFKPCPSRAKAGFKKSPSG